MQTTIVVQTKALPRTGATTKIRLRTSFVRTAWALCLGSCIGLVGACGGSTPPADAADGDNAGSTGAQNDEGQAEGESTGEDAAGEIDEVSEAPQPKEPKQDAKSILLREGTLFMLDIDSSDMGIAIEKKCSKKAGDDVAKKANCVSKEMDKVVREGITFEEADDVTWYYIRFGVEKGAQVIYNRILVELANSDSNKVTLRTTGNDTAPRRKGTVPNELNFEVPDEFTVILHDPKRGRLEFEPKLGILEAPQ